MIRVAFFAIVALFISCREFRIETDDYSKQYHSMIDNFACYEDLFAINAIHVYNADKRIYVEIGHNLILIDADIEVRNRSDSILHILVENSFIGVFDNDTIPLIYATNSAEFITVAPQSTSGILLTTSTIFGFPVFIFEDHLDLKDDFTYDMLNLLSNISLYYYPESSYEKDSLYFLNQQTLIRPSQNIKIDFSNYKDNIFLYYGYKLLSKKYPFTEHKDEYKSN